MTRGNILQVWLLDLKLILKSPSSAIILPQENFIPKTFIPINKKSPIPKKEWGFSNKIT
jgi:hypothetical protein